MSCDQRRRQLRPLQRGAGPSAGPSMQSRRPVPPWAPNDKLSPGVLGASLKLLQAKCHLKQTGQMRMALQAWQRYNATTTGTCADRRRCIDAQFMCAGREPNARSVRLGCSMHANKPQEMILARAVMTTQSWPDCESSGCCVGCHSGPKSLPSGFRGLWIFTCDEQQAKSYAPRDVPPIATSGRPLAPRLYFAIAVSTSGSATHPPETTHTDNVFSICLVLPCVSAGSSSMNHVFRSSGHNS